MADSARIIAKERQALMKLMDQGPFKVPSRRVNENLLIATWNIQNFSNRHTKRAIQYIADICERFDIVALQEVKTNLGGLARLQERLPGNYKILVTDPTGNHERFAFLYDKRTVIPTGLVCEVGFNVPGSSHVGFQLHRMPYCASFRAGRFDFVIASAHIFFGEGSEGEDMREEETKRLAEFIKKRAKKESAKVFDRDFFVVGDFNIEQDGDRFFKALEDQNFVMPPGRRTNFARTKTYDRIVWVKRKSFAFTNDINVVPFGKALFQDKAPKGGKKEISDHLPLWAEFTINKLTQELDQVLNPGG